MPKKTVEWIKQSDYDFETAKYMRSGNRNFYSVFMCHIAVEKALKGLYVLRTGENPPKTHSLVYLLSKISDKPDVKKGKFIVKLNEANVATRYPEELSKMVLLYSDKITDSIISQTGEVLRWIKSRQ